MKHLNKLLVILTYNPDPIESDFILVIIYDELLPEVARIWVEEIGKYHTTFWPAL